MENFIEGREHLVYEYDEHNNPIHFKNTMDGYEWWQEFNKFGKIVHYKDISGYESWRTYDDNGKCIHFRDSKGNDYDEPTLYK